jgi:hypothetical protein
MKKFSLTLLAAGAMAVAGLAQADAIFYPDGTSVELGDNGADSILASRDDSGSLDTTVLGAGSSDLNLMSSSELSSSTDTSILGAGPSVTTTTVTTGPLVYVQPNINWDRTTAMTQLHSNAHLMNRHLGDKSAAATFNSPTRAGEASTMTSGAPNLVTNNDRVIVGSYMIPYTSVTEPYYVFSH